MSGKEGRAGRGVGKKPGWWQMPNHLPIAQSKNGGKRLKVHHPCRGLVGNKSIKSLCNFSGGFPKLRVPVGGPCHKDDRMLGSILGSLNIFWETAINPHVRFSLTPDILSSSKHLCEEEGTVSWKPAELSLQMLAGKTAQCLSNPIA